MGRMRCGGQETLGWNWPSALQPTKARLFFALSFLPWNLYGPCTSRFSSACGWRQPPPSVLHPRVAGGGPTGDDSGGAWRSRGFSYLGLGEGLPAAGARVEPESRQKALAPALL